jgi:hypothetical protein
LASCPLSAAAALFNFMVAKSSKVSRHEGGQDLLEKRVDLDWRTCHRHNNNMLAILDKKGHDILNAGDAIV